MTTETMGASAEARRLVAALEQSVDEKSWREYSATYSEATMRRMEANVARDREALFAYIAALESRRAALTAEGGEVRRG